VDQQAEYQKRLVVGNRLSVIGKFKNADYIIRREAINPITDDRSLFT